MKLGLMIKSELKNFFLVIAYILVASAVYIVWFDSLWHLWYVDVITGLVIIIAGLIIGYFYIKGEYDKKHPKEENAIEQTNSKETTENLEAIEEVKEDNTNNEA